MPVILVNVQTLYPHLFEDGTQLYSRPGILIGTLVSEPIVIDS